METVNVGVIGIGRFGQLHVRVLEKFLDSQVVAIADTNQEILHKVAKESGIPKSYTDPMAIINDPEINVIDIVTDEDSHGELVVNSLLAGKHVFVEKPLATNAEQAQRIHKLALERNKIVMVGNINRFAYPYIMIRESLINGELGDIVAIHCKRNFSRSWFESFGKRTHPVYESGIHEIDLLLYFLQEKCEKVYAVEKYVTKNEFPDTFSSILTFKNGVNCTINSNWCVPNSSPQNLNKGALDLMGTIDATLELVGTKGVAKYDLLNNGLTFWTDSDVQNPDYTLWPRENSIVGGAIRAELQEFIKSVKKGQESDLMPLSHSIESLRIAEAIVHSASSGEIVSL